jgi:hypothetical protein
VPAYGNHVCLEVGGDNGYFPDGLRRVQQSVGANGLRQREQRFDIEDAARDMRCVRQDDKADSTVKGGTESGRVDVAGFIQADDVKVNPLGLLQTVQRHQNRDVIGAARNNIRPVQPPRAMDGQVERMRCASGEDDSLWVRHIEHSREPLSTLPCHSRVVRDAVYSRYWRGRES